MTGGRQHKAGRRGGRARATLVVSTHVVLEQLEALRVNLERLELLDGRLHQDAEPVVVAARAEDDVSAAVHDRDLEPGELGRIRLLRHEVAEEVGKEPGRRCIERRSIEQRRAHTDPEVGARDPEAVVLLPPELADGRVGNEGRDLLGLGALDLLDVNVFRNKIVRPRQGELGWNRRRLSLRSKGGSAG